jgi:hypothetical protein
LSGINRVEGVNLHNADETDAEGAADKQRDSAWLALPVVLLIAVMLAWAVWGASTALWYDESNYLVVAAAIKDVGLPVWFGNPEYPELFLDSPPGLLYLISLLPHDIIYDPALVRMAYVAAFVWPGLVALALYLRNDARRWSTLLATTAFLVCTGYFTMELVQVRMDLPLAGLSFVALVIVAGIERIDLSSGRSRARLPLLLLLAVVSAFALLTKYQAVCLSGALGIWGLVALRDRRGPFSVAVAHGAGLLAAALVVIGVARGFSGGGDGLLLSNLSGDFGRIFANSGAGFDPIRMGELATRAVAIAALPVGLYALARATAPEATRRDPLLNLSLYLGVVVVAFNIVMYRMPGAANYYMIQGALPLAYVAGKSILILSGSARRAAVRTAIGALLTLVVTFQLGNLSLQRWGAGLPALAQGIVQPDQARLVAQELTRTLQPGETVLLDGWQSQGREIPYWLRRSSHYGYLTSMPHDAANAALQREGDGAVAFVVFHGNTAFATLSGPDWQETWRLVTEHYDYVQVAGAPDWTICRRKGHG